MNGLYLQSERAGNWRKLKNWVEKNAIGISDQRWLQEMSDYIRPNRYI